VKSNHRELQEEIDLEVDGNVQVAGGQKMKKDEKKVVDQKIILGRDGEV
jgi:hypothetical protein